MAKRSIDSRTIAINDALRGISTLEAMAVSFVHRGKAEIHGDELTRTEFTAKLAEHADFIRNQLKIVRTALALER